MRPWIILLVGALGLLGGCSSSPAQPPRALLLISIDGLKPDYVTRADDYGLKVPYLRKLANEGVYSSQVRGVLPTSTYPAHTTIMTGVAPARHGIVSNRPFDLAVSPNSWYWFSEEIRVPTLWDAAAEQGMLVGSVSWPVTAGQGSIHYNIPEYHDTRTPADLKVIRALAGPKLMDELGQAAGEYLIDVNNALPRDWARTKHALEIIRLKQVHFLTVHLAASDHLQHQFGPGSAPALAAIEQIDQMVAALDEAMRREHPQARIAIVSDHGFAMATRNLNLDAALIKAGLVQVKGEGANVREAGIVDWTALSWSSGGSAAITLRNRDDADARAQVKAFLDELAADSNNGIAQVLDRDAIAAMGGGANADFWIDLQPGVAIGTALDEPISAPSRRRGVHGHLPTHPEMDSFFLVAGPGIPAGGDLGRMDMRAIAPTLASVMNIPFDSAAIEGVNVYNRHPR